ncbi:MAG: catecholate siderophore receptor Fiu [Moraxellaceae bacterium]
MSSRFEYRPLVLALLALHSAPSLAQEAATAPEAAAPSAPETPAPLAAPADAALAQELQTITVKAQAEAPYKADTVSSPKFTQPLVDTPQTITVIKKEILQEQGAVTLMEALRNTPGITMQMGENGNTSSGDTFQMRGFSTQNSTFVDGIRDLGAVTRDTFNLEQIEVVKGPAGADIGRGASSGYINLVSKLPGLEDSASGTLTVDTVAHKRLTADINEKIGETTALRLNVMGQLGDVPGRNIVENNSWGVAPSLALGLGTDRRTFIYLQHIEQDNVPDGGIPTIGMDGYFRGVTVSGATATNAAQAAAITAGARVNRENFYGSIHDHESVKADMISVKFENDISPTTTVSNISRYGQTTMDRVLTGIASSINGSDVGDPVRDPSTWTVGRSRQAVDQQNRILGNVTNVKTTFETGFIKHDVSTGLEFMYEDQNTLSFSTTGLTVPLANLYNPNPNDILPIPYATGAGSKGRTITGATYLFDTMEITSAWQVTAGIRVERYSTETDALTVVTGGTNGNAAQFPGYTVGQIAPSSLSKEDNLLSGKLGVLYKPAQNGSVYMSYATSQTPPGSANFTLSTSNTNISNPNLDPQETSNIEVGTKWDLLENRLALTAAAYRTENTNEIAEYDAVTNTYTQLGKREIQGVELGAVGNITDAWQLSLGVATMDTEITEGTTGNSSAGAATRWSPDLTATLWTTYALTSDLTVGGGARYISEQKRVVDPTAVLASSNMPEIPAYWVVDAMASYKLLKNLTVRGNIYNLLDEEYISSLNNSGARMMLGAPLYASLSLDFQF